MGDDNKPVAVDTEYHLNSRGWSNPEEEATVISNSFSSDLTELSQLKREQMHNNTRFKVMQSNIEEPKLNLLEKESVIRMETLKVEAEHKRLNLDTAGMQFKAELLRQ